MAVRLDLDTIDFQMLTSLGVSRTASSWCTMTRMTMLLLIEPMAHPTTSNQLTSADYGYSDVDGELLEYHLTVVIFQELFTQDCLDIGSIAWGGAISVSLGHCGHHAAGKIA